MPKGLKVDHLRLRDLRNERAMSLDDLAAKAGVSNRSLAYIEAGVRGARQETIRCLAKALSVATEALLVSSSDATAPTAPAPARAEVPPFPKTMPSPGQSRTLLLPPPTLPPAKMPARTRLDALADLERERGIFPKPVKVGSATLKVLTAARMQDVFATHSIFADEAFWLEGRIDQQRALSTTEARALKARVGVGARFHVVKEIAPGEPLGVTVHVTTAKIARELQAKMKSDVKLVVRVRVAGKNDARVLSLFASQRKRAWGFVVESVAG
jgi:transcriptional regulator with XRE-family HTH domain